MWPKHIWSWAQRLVLLSVLEFVVYYLCSFTIFVTSQGQSNHHPVCIFLSIYEDLNSQLHLQWWNSLYTKLIAVVRFDSMSRSFGTAEMKRISELGSCIMQPGLHLGTVRLYIPKFFPHWRRWLLLVSVKFEGLFPATPPSRSRSLASSLSRPALELTCTISAGMARHLYTLPAWARGAYKPCPGQSLERRRRRNGSGSAFLGEDLVIVERHRLRRSKRLAIVGAWSATALAGACSSTAFADAWSATALAGAWSATAWGGSSPSRLQRHRVEEVEYEKNNKQIDAEFSRIDGWRGKNHSSVHRVWCLDDAGWLLPSSYPEKGWQGRLGRGEPKSSAPGWGWGAILAL